MSGFDVSPNVILQTVQAVLFAAHITARSAPHCICDSTDLDSNLRQQAGALLHDTSFSDGHLMHIHGEASDVHIQLMLICRITHTITIDRRSTTACSATTFCYNLTAAVLPRLLLYGRLTNHTCNMYH